MANLSRDLWQRLHCLGANWTRWLRQKLILATRSRSAANPVSVVWNVTQESFADDRVFFFYFPNGFHGCSSSAAHSCVAYCCDAKGKYELVWHLWMKCHKHIFLGEFYVESFGGLLPSHHFHFAHWYLLRCLVHVLPVQEFRVEWTQPMTNVLLSLSLLLKFIPFLLHIHLQSFPTWETENKIYCKQTLVDGDGPKTFWSRELQGDELTLVRSRLVISMRILLLDRKLKMK